MLDVDHLRPETAATSPTIDSRTSPARGFALILGVVPLLPGMAVGINVQTYVGTLVCLVLAGLALRSFGAPDAKPFALTEIGVGLGAMLLAAVASVILEGTPHGAWFGLLTPLALIATFALTRIAFESRPIATRCIVVLLVSSAVIALFGIVGHIRFNEALASGNATPPDRVTWLSTPFYPHSYIAAQAILPAVPFGLALLLAHTGRRLRIATALLLAPIVLFLVLVLSRMIWLAMTLACAAVALSAARRMVRHAGRSLPLHPAARSALLAIPFGVLALVAANTPWFDGVAMQSRERLALLLDPQAAVFNYSRLQIWSDAIRLAVDHLPFGAGAGRFAVEFAPYDEGMRFIPHAHDQFLQTLGETGVAGLLGLLLATVGALSLALRALARSDRVADDARLLRGALGAMVAMITAFAFETPLLHVSGALWLGVIGGIIANESLRSGVAPRLPMEVSAARCRTVRRIGARFAFAAAIVVGATFALHAVGGRFAWRAQRAFSEGDFVEAGRLAEIAAGIPPQLDWALFIAAEASRRSGDYAASERAFERYERVAPRVPMAELQRAAVLEHLGRHEESLALLGDARRRAPPEMAIEIDFQLANTLTYLGRDEEARALYLSLLLRFAHLQYPDVLRRLADCCLRLGRDRELADSLASEFARIAGAAPARDARR